jgi:hypothetical protein
MSKILFTVVKNEKPVKMAAKFDWSNDLASPLYKNQPIEDDPPR